MRTFFGLLLIAVGALIALATGLCSLSVFDGLRSNTVGASTGDALVTIAIFGGIPFAIGVALAVTGWLLVRRRR